MKRFARTVLLRDDPQVFTEYETYHAHAFPEVIAGLARGGVLRMYIYRFGRQLFMYMETVDDYDPQRAAPPESITPREGEWDQIMRAYQEPVPGAPAGGTWVEMKEVFAFN